MQTTPTLAGLFACMLLGCFVEVRAAEPDVTVKLCVEAKQFTNGEFSFV